MKLYFPSTLLALALIQPSNAFTSVKQPTFTPTNLCMVGFRDPREVETAAAMKSVKRLDYETQKVKRWLTELMSPEDATVESDVTVEKPVEDIGLFGGGGMATISSPTVKLPSYKPSLRSDLGNTVLLTGTYHPSLLRVLNNNDFGSRDTTGGGESGDLIPNFQFEKIILSIAGEEEAKEAKKRVISREARYSGLLDKLVIEAEDGLLPAKERMEGVSSWIVHLKAEEAEEMLPKVSELAMGACSVKNVIVIVEGVSSMTSNVDGWDALMHCGGNFQSTLLAVGELYDQGGEGKYYHIGNFMGEDLTSIELTNSDATAPRMLRSDAYLTLANLLALNVSSNKALGAYEYYSSLESIAQNIEEAKKVIKEGETEISDAPDDDEWKHVKYANRLVRAMREMGFSRLAELDILLDKGVDGYIEFLNAPPKPVKSSEKVKDKWDQMDDEIMAKFDEEIAESKVRREKEEAAKMAGEIKDMARDWAIRQYALKSLRNEVEGMSERDFVKLIWHDALEEGRKLYDVVHSEQYENQMKNRGKPRQEYFYKGMDPMEKKKREIILEKAMQQYMEAYSGGEDLEAESSSSEESLTVDN